MAGRAPIRKVRLGTTGGAVATIAVWLLELVPGVSVPSPVAAAITLLATSGLAYQAHDTPRGQTE